MTLHVSGTEPKKPKLVISEDFAPFKAALIFFGTPAIILLLALKFSFFHSLFIFISIFSAIVMVLVTTAAVDDLKLGCTRKRPEKYDSFTLPKWFQPAYFLTIIGVTAGLKMGYYLVPLAWISIWICFYLTVDAIQKTWEE